MLLLNFLQQFQINPTEALIHLFTFVVSIIVAISVHEFSHALVAYRLGDPTAKLAGRLTLNPSSHLDPLGTLALLFVGFGWGKPTPFDPYNLRNVKRDSALIAVSGAASNFILAILLSLPYLVAYYTHNMTLGINSVYSYLFVAIWLNLILGVFNLIPVAPLDGFKVLAGFLPKDWYHDFIRTEPYGIFILLFLIISGTIQNVLLPIIARLSEVLLPAFIGSI